MTSLEYMERQLDKHCINYDREYNRGVPDEVLHNIELKIGYYEEAVKALREIAAKEIFSQDNN